MGNPHEIYGCLHRTATWLSPPSSMCATMAILANNVLHKLSLGIFNKFLIKVLHSQEECMLL